MKSKKKILLISSSAQLGGGPKHIFLLKDILKDKFDFYLAMPYSNLFKENINMNRYIEISERTISLVDIYKLIFFIKRNSIEIIHAHGKGAGLIGRIIKFLVLKPLIYSFHGIHTQCLSRVGKFFYILYENNFGWIDNEKIFVSLSEMNHAYKLKIFVGNNYSIINNCTENKSIQKIIKNDNNYKIGIDNSKKNIISICRLVDQKNIFEIFRIANLLKNYNFIVIGYGYLYLEAKKYLISKNIDNVYLLGNKKDVFKYLYKSDLFLSTSLYEGHPISIIEAMSVGLPIVATQVMGNCDTIDHNYSGFFYKLGDVNQASNFINLIMENDQIRKKFSKNAVKTQRSKFCLDKMKKSYIELYNKF